MTKRPYGKRIITVPVKLSAEEVAAYDGVGSTQKEDRPRGYVLRELALRGLVEYRKDGKLRATDEEIAAALATEQKVIPKKKLVNS